MDCEFEITTVPLVPVGAVHTYKALVGPSTDSEAVVPEHTEGDEAEAVSVSPGYMYTVT